MKIAQLLKSLHPDEYKDFEKFLQSPFFKVSDQYLKFFRYLCKHHPSFELEKAALQAAYQRCYGRDSFTESKLYNLLSGMSKQVEDYLVVHMVIPSEGKEGQLYNQLLVSSLGNRNMGAYYRKEALQLIADTSNRVEKDADDYLMLHQLHQEVYFNPDTPKFTEDPPHLKLSADYLDLYYCIAKLRTATEMKARERLLNVRYEQPLLEAVLERSAAPELLETHPVLAIYHLLVNLHSSMDEPGFIALMTVFIEKRPLLPRFDQLMLLKHLINSGISLVTRDIVIEPELLTLYKLALEVDMLTDNNRITHPTFINIANLGSYCGDFDWTNAFIAQFSPMLEEKIRQAAIDLAFAGVYHNQGMLDEAQSRLTPAIYTIQFFDIMARSLLLRIVFDRYILYGKDCEFLSAQVKSFEKYIQFKNLTPEKKKIYLNWVRFVRKMLIVKNEMVDVPESNKASLRKKLAQLQPMISRKWLKEKIEAL